MAFFMQLEVGSVLDGKVTGITKFGAFVELEKGTTGLVHISEVASSYVKEISDHLKLGQAVKVKVLKVGDDGKISLSIKQAQADFQDAPRAQRREPNRDNAPSRKPQTAESAFEDMLNRFKQTSEEKMSDIKRNMDGKRGSYSRRK